MKLTMIYTRETKNALVYGEVDDKGVINDDPASYAVGTLYLRKHAFDGKLETITVTIEDAASVQPAAAPVTRRRKTTAA